MNEKQRIMTLLSEQTVKSQSDYRTRLNAFKVVKIAS